MEFILLNLTNCCIENLILVLLFATLTAQTLPKRNYVFVYILIFFCSCIFTFIDSFLFSILPFNFSLIFLCFLGAFHIIKIETVFWNSLISYLLLIYFQVIFVCIYPAKLMGTHAGNFAVNISTLVCTILLYSLSQHFHFQENLVKNTLTIRIFFLALCLPEFITGQFFVSLLSSAPKVIMLCLLLLQFLYVTLLLLVFFTVTHKQERRQFQNTKQHIDTLNQILDDSKQSIHDFNKHIRYLQNTVTVRLGEKQYDALQNEIDNYCHDLLEQSEKEESILYLDDPVLRALLYGRRTQAKTLNIDFTIDAVSAVLPSFPLKNYQMVEVFDNLLNNAFECVETLSCNRWIRVVLNCEKTSDGHYKNILCIQNPYEDLDYSAIISDNNYSSKKGEHKGVGLKKVANLVTETNGKLILNNDNHVFSVKVVYEE